ncbi:MAG: alpha/beta hydrolase-fold protein [Bacteroidota bacterium]
MLIRLLCLPLIVVLMMKCTDNADVISDDMDIMIDSTYIDSTKIALRGEVVILDRDFNMPNLNRTRKVWLYLPRDYYASNKYYPVLYMHDGQNLFDATASFAGEWYVDESLDAIFGAGKESAIVVGIENSRDQNRLNEYSPWQNGQYQLGGEGNLYVDFIVNELKPYIDSIYRTKREREFTGIMGSSMGGLISLYAAIERQDVFGRAGIFSPSLWFTEGKAFEHVSNKGKQRDAKIYLIAGEREGSNAAAETRRMSEALRASGFQNHEIFIETHPDGEHNEAYWAREFPKAYEWLFLN